MAPHPDAMYHPPGMPMPSVVTDAWRSQDRYGLVHPATLEALYLAGYDLRRENFDHIASMVSQVDHFAERRRKVVIATHDPGFVSVVFDAELRRRGDDPRRYSLPHVLRFDFNHLGLMAAAELVNRARATIPAPVMVFDPRFIEGVLHNAAHAIGAFAVRQQAPIPIPEEALARAVFATESDAVDLARSVGDFVVREPDGEKVDEKRRAVTLEKMWARNEKGLAAAAMHRARALLAALRKGAW